MTRCIVLAVPAVLLLACGSSSTNTTTSGTSSGSGGTTTGGATTGGSSGGTTGTMDAGSTVDAGDCRDAGCSSGQFCDQNTGCTQKFAVGACGNQTGYHQAHEVCQSGFCLGGACCTSVLCHGAGTVCGATTCGLTTGACLYVDAGTVCGVPGCDAGALVAAAACDGLGVCQPGTPASCDPYACDPQGPACRQGCLSAADCLPTSYCTAGNGDGGSCCDVPAQMYADSQLGSDQGCCGTPANPCRTLTTALQHIVSVRQSGVTLHAAVNGGGGDWTGAEQWPVKLTLGVTLHAPGVFFAPTGPAKAFVVASNGPSDVAGVTIEGDATAGVYTYVGFDSTGAHAAGTTVAVDDAQGPTKALPLTLDWVWLNGSQIGLDIGPGATVDGPVRPGVTQDTNLIGGFPGTSTPSGSVGIHCLGDSSSPAIFNGRIAVSFQDTDVVAGDFCSMFFDHANFGLSPVAGACMSKPDGLGIQVTGSGAVSTATARISCILGDGVAVESASGNGAPAFAGDTTTLENCGCAGLHVMAGTGALFFSTVLHNHYGVVQETGGQVNGNIFQQTTIACATSQEPGTCFGDGNPGVDVWNHSPALMYANNTQWDHAPPDLLICSDQFVSCVCNGGTCGGTGYDGTDMAITPDPTGADGGAINYNTYDAVAWPAGCN
jgi:hypothetical protein